VVAAAGATVPPELPPEPLPEPESLPELEPLPEPEPVPPVGVLLDFVVVPVLPIGVLPELPPEPLPEPVPVPPVGVLLYLVVVPVLPIGVLPEPPPEPLPELEPVPLVGVLLDFVVPVPPVGALPDFVVAPPPEAPVLVGFPTVGGEEVSLFNEPVGMFVGVLVSLTGTGILLVEGIVMQEEQEGIGILAVVPPRSPDPHCPLAVHVEGLLCDPTISTIEASVINFARILEERIFISYLLFIVLFVVGVGGRSSSREGKRKKCKKKRE